MLTLTETTPFKRIILRGMIAHPLVYVRAAEILECGS